MAFTEEILALIEDAWKMIVEKICEVFQNRNQKYIWMMKKCAPLRNSIFEIRNFRVDSIESFILGELNTFERGNKIIITLE